MNTNTITVGTLLKMLSAGEVSEDTPIAIYHRVPICLVGVVSVEMVSMKDESQILVVHTGTPCASLNDVVVGRELPVVAVKE